MLSFVEENGNCGPTHDVVVMIPPNGQLNLQDLLPPGADCKTTPRYNECTVFLDERCRLSDGKIETVAGKVELTPDGAAGQGTVVISVARGCSSKGRCVSTYSVDVVRL
jgi:hypothetical protein